MKHNANFSFLEALYYDNLSPNVRNVPPHSRMAKLFKAFSDAEDKLMQSLSEEDRQTLTMLISAHAEIVGNSERDCFCMGFRLGALAMLDVMSGEVGMVE